MSTPSLSGRPWRRAQAAVFATETHCWLCGEHVEQTLPPNHDRARSVDHITPLALGGAPYERSNLRLAHRRCNLLRGAGEPTRTNPRSVAW